MFFSIILVILCASQLYWAWRARAWIWKVFPTRTARLGLAGTALAVFLLMLAFSLGWIGGRGTPVRLTAGAALLEAPFGWWIACSLFAFLVLLAFWAGAAVFLGFRWLRRRVATRKQLPEIESPARRIFFGRTASAVAAAPFVAGAYGLLYGRLNLETSNQPIRLKRLPKAFDGFRIAQLSDIHIGPFMPGGEIRKYATIANSLKPDLIVLTGDYVTMDPATQGPVVEALSGLKAPFGVFGCLGNHDAWAVVQDSITLLFRKAGIRILRQQRVPITAGGESINLIGIDYQSRQPMGRWVQGMVRHYLEGVADLMDRERVNILLSHNPNTFDRAAEMGIDLSLAGHTHGGQAALEFISPELAPSRLVTPYVAGLFEKPGGQLYVNRGIGTIGVPIRIGAPPEITLYVLKRG